MKDWTGNKNSTFSTLGASNHSDYERAENDFYATDPLAIDLLVEKVDEIKGLRLNSKIWECSAGNGHLSKRLIEKGFSVFSSDIIEREFPVQIIDFLKTDKKWNGDIITNPPYKYAQEFVEQGIKLLEEKDIGYVQNKLIMFLKITFLEGQKRRKMFEKYPPHYVFVFSKRIQVARNGDPEMFKKSSAACYAWFIWEKDFIGNTIIKWI